MPARRPPMLTTRELEKPIVFAWLSESVRLEMATHAGGRVETASALFDGLGALAFTYLIAAVEEEGDLGNRIIARDLSPELSNVIKQIEVLELATSNLSSADWETLALLDEEASRSWRDAWRDRALCLDLDVIDFFDAFWMRTLELSMVRGGVRKGRGRRAVRTEPFDELGDSIVLLWLNVTQLLPTSTKNNGGFLAFVSFATNHLTGSVKLARFSGSPGSATSSKFQKHYQVERTIKERRPTIRGAAKAGLQRWIAAQAEIK